MKRISEIESKIKEKALRALGGPRITLAEMALYINANSNNLIARVEDSWSNTDSKISGTRFRREGRGRQGKKLIVNKYNTDGSCGDIVLEHDSSETYRNNNEAAYKVVQLIDSEATK